MHARLEGHAPFHEKAQRGQVGQHQREMVTRRGEGIVILQPLGDGGLVRPKMHRRRQAKRERLGAFEVILNHDRVLPVRHDDSLCERAAVDRISPHRDAAIETEFDQRFTPQPILERAEHHHPPERVLERRDKQSVIAARDGAVDGARAEAADTVRHQPFALDELSGGSSRVDETRGKRGRHLELITARRSRHASPERSVADSAGIAHTPSRDSSGAAPGPP